MRIFTTQVKGHFYSVRSSKVLFCSLFVLMLFVQKQVNAQAPTITVTNTSPTGCSGGGTCNGSVSIQSSGGFMSYSTLTPGSDLSGVTTNNMNVDQSSNGFSFTGTDASDVFNNQVVTNQLFVDNGSIVAEADFQVDETAGYFGLAPASPFFPSPSDYLYAFFYHDGLLDFTQSNGLTGPIANPSSPDGHFHVNPGVTYHLKIQKTAATVTYSVTGSDGSTGIVSAAASPITGQFKLGASVFTSGTFTTKNWSVNFNPATTGLCPGTYTYTVLNASGASASQSVTLSGGLTAGDITMYPSTTVPGQASQTIYLGYGLQAVLLYAGSVSGTGPFTYTWSPTNSLISYAGYAVVFPTTTTTYSLTIKNAAGCSVTKTFTVYVVDVRCGYNKVSVCHTYKGKSTTQCVNYDDVNSHLQKGDKLGACGSGQTLRADENNNLVPAELTMINALTVKAVPNPSTAYFKLVLNSNTDERISLKVFDGLGRLIESKEGLKPGTSLNIGANYHRGIYIVEAIQGEHIESTKLIKQ